MVWVIKLHFTLIVAFKSSYSLTLLLQGETFNWSSPELSITKSLYNLRQLEKLLASFMGSFRGELTKQIVCQNK